MIVIFVDKAEFKSKGQKKLTGDLAYKKKIVGSKIEETLVKLLMEKFAYIILIVSYVMNSAHRMQPLTNISFLK